jgi:asparagine synthase (glutamine-hydrolysing)
VFLVVGPYQNRDSRLAGTRVGKCNGTPVAGLIAAFDPKGPLEPLDALVGSFPSHATGRDTWRDERCIVIRLHHHFHAAPQPTWSESGLVALFFDGELFGDSAAEVDPGAVLACAVRLFMRGDHRAVARLNGSFAAVAYDLERCQLHLITDRINTRPLYYFISGSLIVVASHVAALAIHPRCPRRLNRHALHQVVAYERVVDGSTIYADVRCQEPASVSTFDGDALSSTAYWRLNWSEPAVTAPEAAAEALASTLKAAVHRRVSDVVRPGLLLSGGLDSRAILAVSGRSLTCFTQATAYNNEVRLAERAASLQGSAFRFHRVEPSRYAEFFDEGVRMTGGIQRAQAAHFLAILHAIRAECDTLLIGYGFDGFLRGLYLPARMLGIGPWRTRLPQLMPLTCDSNVATLARTLRSLTRRSGVERVLRPTARLVHEAELEDAIRTGLAGFESTRSDCRSYDVWDYLELRSVAHLRAYANVLCVRAWIDDRVVGFDRDLLEVALALPPQWRLPDTAYRAAVKRILPGELARLSDATTGVGGRRGARLASAAFFVKRAGDELRRRMMDPARRSAAHEGSWPEFAELLRQNPTMRARTLRLAASDALDAATIFDRRGVQALVDEHLSGSKNHTNLLLILLMVESWIRQFGTTGAE